MLSHVESAASSAVKTALDIGASAIHGMASAAAAGGKQPKEQPVVGLRRSPRNRKATKKYE